jgi:hypothetical protein
MPVFCFWRARRRPAQRCQYRVHRDGGVTDKGCLGARREEAHPEVMVGGIGSQHESRVANIEFARDQLHLLDTQPVGIQYYSGRIAGEALAGEGVDLEDGECAGHDALHAIIHALNLGVAILA